MSPPLPDGNYQEHSEAIYCQYETQLFNSDERVSLLNARNCDCFLDINMDNPDELHERYDDYPLALKIMTDSKNLTRVRQIILRSAYFDDFAP